ncbi:helix-turn-helix transcriptional regulator [Spirosoma sp. KNUC1025]|uniref:ArsR/SmtB family transcription factor n=1 Tax=Spirosoma sp. KNUC1025 TaxID=2894082 RepID=UPI00386E39C5|nr:metalloregulator ArsR/SmtB family transcription factor [Spirosoma sp. KNUC1025]
MTDSTLIKASELLKLLANPIRLQILLLLADQPSLSGKTIHQLLELDAKTVAQYLIKLRTKGLLVSRRQGHEVYYSLVNDALVNFIRQLIGLVEQKLAND